MDYDYDLYSEVITGLVKSSDIDFVEDLEIGVNISPAPEVKVIFDGFGDLEETDEDGEPLLHQGRGPRGSSTVV